jgi:hypothetical protein
MVFVQSNGEFRIRTPAELVVGLGLEVFPDIIIVVELAIDDSMDGAFIVMEGLDTIGRQVIDG